MAAATQKIVIHADDRTGPGTNSAVRNAKKLDHQLNKTNQAMRGMTRQGRAQMAQLGHQIQDVSVQMQMGMNPLMILGQQGSQIASVFGTKGPVIGSIIAVGAALAYSFIPSLNETNETLDNLLKKAERLDTSLKKLMPREYEKRLEKAEQAVSDAAKAHGDAVNKLFDLEEAQTRAGYAALDMRENVLSQGAAQENSRSLVQALSRDISDQQDRVEKAKVALLSAKKALEEFKKETGTTSKELSERAEGLEALIAAEEARTAMLMDALPAEKKFLNAVKEMRAVLGDPKTPQEVEAYRVQIEKLALKYFDASAQARKLAAEQAQQAKAQREAERKFNEILQNRQELQDILDKRAQALSQKRIRLLDEAVDRNQKLYQHSLMLKKVLVGPDGIWQTHELQAFAFHMEKLTNELFPAVDNKVKSSAEKIAKFKNNTKELTDSLIDAGENGLTSLENGLVGLSMGTKTAAQAFKDMARSIIEDLIRINIQQSVTPLFRDIFSSAIGFGTGTSSADIDAQSSAAADAGIPRRALGGPVSARQPYMVGERGPELFIPSGNGKIVSNHNLGGGDTVNISLNISTGVPETVRTELQSMLPQIQEVAKTAVFNAKARGYA